LPPGRQPGGVEMLQDAPHQEVGIEVLRLNLQPLLSPDPEVPDQVGELASSLREVVRRASANGVRPRLYHSVPLEAAQPLAEHAGGDRMKTLQDFTEVVAACHDLAEDQRGPALGEYLRG